VLVRKCIRRFLTQPVAERLLNRLAFVVAAVKLRQLIERDFRHPVAVRSRTCATTSLGVRSFFTSIADSVPSRSSTRRSIRDRLKDAEVETEDDSDDGASATVDVSLDGRTVEVEVERADDEWRLASTDVANDLLGLEIDD
jgi:hypothetical protein